MTEQYKGDLSNWESKNMFFDDKEFSALQMSLVPIKILYGNYQTYQTQIKPIENQLWKHVILLPGTAFKFSNKLNAQYTAKSILSIMEIKNIPTKIHVISHRVNPIYPQAQSDTLEMLQILIEEEKLKQVSILTWSAGCSYLQKVFKKSKQLGCDINRVCMISPVVDFQNKKRQKRADFLNQDFFQFVQKVYCSGDLQKVGQLSLMNSIYKKQTQFFDNIISTPISIVYGGEEYIKQDIEEFIKVVNECKKLNRLQQIDCKIIANQNHALFSFVTSVAVRKNEKSMKKISKTKWLVSKYIADILQKDNIKGQNKNQASPFIVPEEIKSQVNQK